MIEDLRPAEGTASRAAWEDLDDEARQLYAAWLAGNARAARDGESLMGSIARHPQRDRIATALGFGAGPVTPPRTKAPAQSVRRARERKAARVRREGRA